jgi:pimeloyl-ACP methyl ester carboxylesterase
MPLDTHENTPTQFVKAGGVRFAYRRFGRRGGTPLLLLNYFAANLDKWDPKVTNGLAAERDVILVDYPGIGGSSGETPLTVAALTNACVEFCRALDLTRFDVLGFSLGGMIAQQLAADDPERWSGASFFRGRVRAAGKEWSPTSRSTSWTTKPA